MTTTSARPRGGDEAATSAARRRAVVAAAASLAPVSARTRLSTYTRQVLARWPFIRAMAASQLSAKHGRDRLGSAWLVLTPLLNAGTYFLIFGVLLNTRRGVENFVGFLIIGVFVYQYSASSINEGAKVMTRSTRLMQTLHFPRAVLPLASVLRQLMGFVPALLVMCVLVLAIPPHGELSWRWLLVVPVLALQTAFNLGLVLVLARLVARVNDVTNLLQFVMRAWMYFSGVFYSFDRFDAYPQARAVLELNPLHAFMTIVRDALLYGEATDARFWWVAVGWSVALLAVGWVVFWRGELEYGRV